MGRKRAETSEQIKDLERRRRNAEDARQEARRAERGDEPTAGDRLREVYHERRVDFHAVGPQGQVVMAGPLGLQQVASLTRVFEADGYTVVK
jgi:hypothetical protein